ncbi:hypothetical protein NE237_003685 [Protea cynaroides]|uniref:Uncharacterized protein n=1 Tax=Protea cynaroides TaxID=273540 RepID=A0A9Q0KHJ4_9MAGN|nr:hypothetical protein NE237_003685 [Protea cynaroides]
MDTYEPSGIDSPRQDDERSRVPSTVDVTNKSDLGHRADVEDEVDPNKLEEGTVRNPDMVANGNGFVSQKVDDNAIVLPVNGNVSRGCSDQSAINQAEPVGKDGGTILTSSPGRVEVVFNNIAAVEGNINMEGGEFVQVGKKLPGCHPVTYTEEQILRFFSNDEEIDLSKVGDPSSKVFVTPTSRSAIEAPSSKALKPTECSRKLEPKKSVALSRGKSSDSSRKRRKLSPYESASIGAEWTLKEIPKEVLNSVLDPASTSATHGELPSETPPPQKGTRRHKSIATKQPRSEKKKGIEGVVVEEPKIYAPDWDIIINDSVIDEENVAQAFMLGSTLPNDVNHLMTMEEEEFEAEFFCTSLL